MIRKILKNSQVLVALANALRSVGPDFRRLKAWIVRPKILRAYLETHSVKKLQLGSGPNVLKGWLNTDFRPTKPGEVYLDATKRFPFLSETFDFIFSEHLIGEFSYQGGVNIFRESFRILKPGGKIRVSTPDFDQILGLGAPSRSDAQNHYLQWTIRRYLPDTEENAEVFVINRFFRTYFVYSREMLRSALLQAGFLDLQWYEPGVSTDPNLTGLESHGKIIGEEIDRFESMVVEAVKPQISQ